MSPTDVSDNTARFKTKIASIVEIYWTVQCAKFVFKSRARKLNYFRTKKIELQMTEITVKVLLSH